jgi:hypothetical protein
MAGARRRTAVEPPSPTASHLHVDLAPLTYLDRFRERDGGHVDALSFTGEAVTDELELIGVRRLSLPCFLSLTRGVACLAGPARQ